MTISIDSEKAFEKIQFSFMVRTLKKLGIERSYLSIIKDIYNESMTNIILIGEDLKAFPLKSYSLSTFPTLIQCSA
jgi:hypothetical protein